MHSLRPIHDGISIINFSLLHIISSMSFLHAHENLVQITSGWIVLKGQGKGSSYFFPWIEDGIIEGEGGGGDGGVGDGRMEPPRGCTRRHT